MAINLNHATGGALCIQIVSCFEGCKSGAKWLPVYGNSKAEATGKARFTTESQALRLLHDAKGKVSGVLMRNKDATSGIKRPGGVRLRRTR